jgi:hypothetical protein
MQGLVDLLLKPVSQIHRFHLRLGYDALTACFLVISVSGRTAPLLPLYCSSSFFHAAGAPFKAPASFNFSLKFSECRWRAVQKMHRKVVERWLYGVLPGAARLFSNANQNFFLHYKGPIACVRLQGSQGRLLKGGRPSWRVWRALGRGPVGPPSVPQLQEKGARQPPSGGCSRDHFLADI